MRPSGAGRSLVPGGQLVIGGPMVDSEPGAGGPPVFGWRRSARAARNVLPSGPAPKPSPDVHERPPDGVQPPTDQLPACPWLYMHTDPDARAAFVTADHRCEIRPEEIPGPGHQLAYCLTLNHVSCPQLRSYEAQRHAVAQEQSARQSPLAPATRPARSAAQSLPAPQLEGIRRFGSNTERSRLFGRLIWAAGGVVGTLVLVAGLAMIASPGGLSSAPQTQPTAVEGSRSSLEAPEDAAPLTYTVRPGDTLGKIARDLGISVGDLLAANDFTADTVVVVGDELRLPATLAGAPPADVRD